jgi:hypothetical protein
MLGLADLRVVWGQKYTQCFVGITHWKSAIWNTENYMYGRGDLGCKGRGGEDLAAVCVREVVLHLRVQLVLLY